MFQGCAYCARVSRAWQDENTTLRCKCATGHETVVFPPETFLSWRELAKKRGAPLRGAPLRGQTRRGRRVDDSEVGAHTEQDLVDVAIFVVVEAGLDVHAGAGAKHASQVDV